MCGIVGVVAQRDVCDILIEGLRRLEYRGYDSAGLAVLGEQGLEVRKVSGPVDGLALKVRAEPADGSIGIAHTRWATHGEPSATNAHPHLHRDIAVVHNGIIENHHDLRSALKKSGGIFRSETDSEVIPHLIADSMEQGLVYRAPAAAEQTQEGRHSQHRAVLERASRTRVLYP